MADEYPVYRVRRDGTVDRLGQWVHRERRLLLERAGFPLLPPGDHRLDSDLPWIFWDMCPAGYLGRLFQRRVPELGLNPDPARWSPEDCLRILSTHGQDLSGNLVVGDASLAAFRAWQFDGREAPEQLRGLLGEVFRPGDEPSLGGERPKLVASSADGAGYLMKFSPPRVTPQGQRWSDLLRVEAHCARVLSSVGVPAARASAGTTDGRTTLFLPRFDRLRGRGRVGAATLFWYAMDQLGEVNVPAPTVVQTLVDLGHLPAGAVETCARVQAFSEAIGNTDTHLGNYGLLFDEDGRASLAPFYDVLPMAFAPRHDELPDAYLAPRGPAVDERVRPWVEALADAVEADVEISDRFRGPWRRFLWLT